jgi:t-SNARE complex subunit (syntaxin)
MSKLTSKFIDNTTEDELIFMELKEEEHDTEELLRREEQIKKIYKDVLEISTFMCDLNSLVQEQDQDIKHIEESIEYTKTQSEKAHEELVKAEEYQSSYYKKIYYIPILLGTIVVGLFGFMKT